MKRKPEAEPMAISLETHEEREEEEDDGDQETLEGSGDVCGALMGRYAKSSAPQHRHLCASAAAMRAILQEEGLPLTPSAYFAAAITALRDSSSAHDPDAASALAAFLSILLPLLPAPSLPPPKAKDAAFVLAGFLRSSVPGGAATGTVRSIVKSLGFVALLLDFEDWEAVELPLETVLLLSVDRRPKVRRCAQECVEKIFRALKGSDVVKKASLLVLRMFEKYIPQAEKLVSNEFSDASAGNSNPEIAGILYLLNLLGLLVPNLNKKVRMKILSEAYKLLPCRFNMLTRHILKLLEALAEHLEIKYLDSDAENFIFALTSFISSHEKNPMDTTVSALKVLKNSLRKLENRHPGMWMRTLPVTLAAVAGYLRSDVDSSKVVALILKDWISFHSDWRVFVTDTNQSLEETTILSICLVLDKMLSLCDLPSENMLMIISVLFLRLGESSDMFMKEILIKLSQWAMNVNKEKPLLRHIHECIGSAAIAMGPEKILSLVPITFDEEKLTCSNTWLVPILKQYMFGASLQFFMEHILPIAKSIKIACNKAKKVSNQKRLQSFYDDLWSLLPAFCHYPTDTSQNFGSLAKLLTAVLKEDPSLHQTIATALQELVKGNKHLLSGNQDANLVDILPSFSLEIHDVNCRGLPYYYSKRFARKNMKETLRCLFSLIGSADIRSLFLSLLERFSLSGTIGESDNLEGQIPQVEQKEEQTEATETEKEKEKMCLVMELLSIFVEAADKDLISLFFDFIKSSLLDGNDSCQAEAYLALSKILKDHSWFCLAQVDEIMMLLHGLKTTFNSTALKNRLSCFQFLLVHMLKINEEDINTKAFLILNEIILTLKSKKESRKVAYDALLATSHSLKNSQSANRESDLQRLFTMVMGYLSSPSPHIMSGAISALSLLIYNDADFCLAVPNLIPSVLVLLQNKSNEVIKAALGFVKVLVSSLRPDNLKNLQADIITGILPWSSVSKHHFRSKVAIILEILIRKCGFDALDIVVPEKYKGFVRTIAEGRQSKKNPIEAADSEKAPESTGSATKRAKKPDGLKQRPVEATSNRRSWSIKKHKKNGSAMKENNQTRDSKGSRGQSIERASRFNSRIGFKAHLRNKESKNEKKSMNKNEERKRNIRGPRRDKGVNNTLPPPKSNTSFISKKRKRSTSNST
ncbi:RRP12-like protein isoform X2 [Ananas comosus]|uniref:RRP12-like protein isoform X2 n=1 Tax=Ananas comosus TaxID=4615 RepID=A0A6P5ETK2_ANACO|nr:RRP12-like protein isoform X2 [Ananas comosus]